MNTYISNPSRYTRQEVEAYLADLWAQGNITEQAYDNFLEKMDKVVFKDENIQAQAVA
jgi:hypothetical protein